MIRIRSGRARGTVNQPLVVLQRRSSAMSGQSFCRMASFFWSMIFFWSLIFFLRAIQRVLHRRHG